MANINLASPSNCTGCHSCYSICPSSSITMTYNKYGFLQPFINHDTCLKCHLCEKTCPIITPRENRNNDKLRVVSSILKDEIIRNESTSGGAFWVLASYVISKGGVVFGVAFDGVHVRHCYTENLEGLHAFMGSKYVQSEIGDSYKDVKKFLKEDRLVLFTGTPCQIAGLNSYLRKDHPKLLNVELLCRGVPSPKVWEKYIKEKLIELKGHDIKNIRFRTKSPNYSSPVFSYVLKFTYLDESDKRKEFWEDCRKNPFFSYFMHHIFRSSCYQCKFRNTFASGTDITIGDAITDSPYGVEKENKVSTIVVHTRKGGELFGNIGDKVLYNEFDISVLENNYLLSAKNARRDSFLKAWRLSCLLAQRFPLCKIRVLYEYALFSVRAIFALKRVILSTK